MQKNTFGEWLRTTREAKHLSQRALAAEMGVTPGYIWQVERGTAPIPTDDRLERLAEVLGEDREQVFKNAGRLPEDLFLTFIKVRDWDAVRSLPWDEISRRLRQDKNFTLQFTRSSEGAEGEPSWKTRLVTDTKQVPKGKRASSAKRSHR
jgi:transcriptional regulator with XRE-family HTH domain